MGSMKAAVNVAPSRNKIHKFTCQNVSADKSVQLMFLMRFCDSHLNLGLKAALFGQQSGCCWALGYDFFFFFFKPVLGD